MRRSLLALAMQFIAFSSPLVAAADSITYEIEMQSSSMRYVSGDLPCEVEALLRGQLTISTEEASNEATLQFSGVTLHSPRTLLAGTPHEYPVGDPCRVFAESLKGAALADVMPGVNAEIDGLISAAGGFTFGPTPTEQLSHTISFTLDSSGRLVGSSLFFGDDGGSFFIDASLAPVPEPQSLINFATATAVIAMSRKTRMIEQRLRNY